jgi:4-hydroxy-tetrahydrodipicolinate reductase
MGFSGNISDRQNGKATKQKKQRKSHEDPYHEEEVAESTATNANR